MSLSQLVFDHECRFLMIFDTFMEQIYSFDFYEMEEGKEDSYCLMPVTRYFVCIKAWIFSSRARSVAAAAAFSHSTCSITWVYSSSKDRFSEKIPPAAYIVWRSALCMNPPCL
ncbi:predicted protein [Pyrenophora tritici-repentis Pt-1C-BFP]|uniref:Uncharacterized protein n=1 Tax=Pyrenophora tritici-repentis (strain Pt-1C-BFP) TaxID=426418 RepID=B2W459_PYRTR|nr:uncharacterized protein PTRG_05259 [Pyrenophora tritici-repentis Pt-1C-BFP]EDU48166.1 predicted protein [Pyrenophora tritici-repentis Pt-1C-BFP]